MKLAGEFEFLGYAYRGDPEFDRPPPKGVVKLFYLGLETLEEEAEDAPEAVETGGRSERCGFYRCPWWRWAGFKEAVTRHQPDRAARGRYPVASIVAKAPRMQTAAVHGEASSAG